MTTQIPHERPAGPFPPAGPQTAWFLGPRAENEEVFTELITDAIASCSRNRREFYPDDPACVTDAVKATHGHREGVAAMRGELAALLSHLRGSVPFSSHRYQAHILWDQTMPSMAGYFAGMLHNPNNLAGQASPVTTVLEVEVGLDLCRMLGYDVDGPVRPWGHLTCDGTVANLEALWSARNLKFYPVAVAEAIRGHAELAAARDLVVTRPDGSSARLLDLSERDVWALLNLDVERVLGLTGQMVELGVDPAHLELINAHTVQHLGYAEFHHRFLAEGTGPPAILVAATMHYSWLKAAALLGLGQGNVVPVDVDLDGRADPVSLRERLLECLARRRPVVAAVAIMGSTEQSCVDPLAEMLAVRAEFAGRNLAYPIHADAAFGGYFATLRRPPARGRDADLPPAMDMSPYVNAQYDRLGEVDSITVDPHKVGFVPYPAGGLCYRDERQRFLVAFMPPYLDGGREPGVGFFGVEGSKPGAAAAGVWLSHRVVPPDRGGHGRLLGRALFNSRRLYAAIATLGVDHEDILVVPGVRLPAERDAPGDATALREQSEFILERIVERSNDQVMRDPEARDLLARLGSDQIACGYVVNLVEGGTPQPSLRRANALNTALAARLGMRPVDGPLPGLPAPEDRPPLFLHGSHFAREEYGPAYVGRLIDRLGVDDDPEVGAIDYVISCTMNPWVSETEVGDFIPALRAALADAIREVAKVLPRSGGDCPALDRPTRGHPDRGRPHATLIRSSGAA